MKSPQSSTAPSRLPPAIVAVLLCVAGPIAMGAEQAPDNRSAGVVRLEGTEALRMARQARGEVSVQIADGLELSLWAPDSLVIDPVAIDFDDQGAAYITSSSRSGFYVDIREHANWVPLVHGFRSNAELLRFYRAELAPSRTVQNKWLPDLNKDGSRDWRDLGTMKERIYRIRDEAGGGVATSSHMLFEGFNDNPTFDVATALLYHEGTLLVGTAPGVWRLQLDGRGGKVSAPRAVSEGYNLHPAYFGHGISGLVVAPDGRLYWEVGDMGLSVVDGAGRRHTYPNQGAVLRANPDGSDLEVFATGIRNLQDIAFDELGNLISVDNDADYEGETERLVHITEGSDLGWRSNSQYGKYTDPANNRYNVWMEERVFKTRFEGQAAHIVPPFASFHAGPSGMVYNPGTALSSAWRGHFLVSSFTGAAATTKVFALTLKEEGSSFAVERETLLLQGILTPGMRFAPDGALYLTDWISGWESKGKGRVWKLDVPGAASDPLRAEVRAFHVTDPRSLSTPELAAWLRHADMRIRLRAQFELVRRREAGVLESALRSAGDRIPRLHGLWGLGQLARRDSRTGSRLLQFLADPEPEVRAQAAREIGDARIASAGPRLVPLLADASPRVRFFAAQAIGRIAYRPGVQPLVAMLAENADRDLQLRHAGCVALSRIGDRDALYALDAHASPSVRTAAVVALRRMRDAGLARFMTDSDERIATEAARAINDDGGVTGALGALALSLSADRFTAEPLLRRAISANQRLGSAEAVARVQAFAANPVRPAALRLEAIGALGTWAAPSAFDRVDGALLERSASRNGAAARAAVLELVRTLGGAAAPDPVKIGLAEAVSGLRAQPAAADLFSWLRADTSPAVRQAALRALADLNPASLAEVAAVGLADADGSVRQLALGLVPALALDEGEKVRRTMAVYEPGSLEDRQAVLGVLGKLRGPEAERALADFVAELEAGRLPAGVQVELTEAVESGGSDALKERLRVHLRTRGADTVAHGLREGLLAGGKPAPGRSTFTTNPVVGCTKCHKVGETGSDVGPNLTNIGGTLSREELLQAILEPSARIAPGFGNAPSSMPAFGKILSPREIRDLVEYLGGLSFSR